MKQPTGPVTKATPTPPMNPLNMKSSISCLRDGDGLPRVRQGISPPPVREHGRGCGCKSPDSPPVFRTRRGIRDVCSRLWDVPSNKGDEHKYYDLDDEERCKNKGELGKWVKEESAFVADIDDPHGDGERLKEDLIYFGKRYDQDGVLFLPLYDDYVFEIDPETSEMEKKGRKSKVLEVMQKLTGGYTRIRNRFFQFSEVREIPMLSWFDTISERISYQRHFNSGKTLEEMQKKESWLLLGKMVSGTIRR